MQPLRYSLISTLFLSSVLLLLNSCEREDSQAATEQEVTASRVSTEADGEAEVIFNGLFDDALGVNNQVGMGGTGIFGRNMANVPGETGETMRPGSCPTVRITHPTNHFFPVHVVLDFGSGCIGRDGRHRRGKILITYTNRLTIPGAVAETTFDGFYVDSIHVEGVHRIENTGSLVPPARSFKVDVIHGKLTKPNGDYTEWDSHKEIVQIEGLLTPDFPHDDIFRITGHAEGNVRRGNLLVRWTSNIREPLIKRFNCRWLVKGVVRTVRGPNTNHPWVAELDFGYPTPGTCDNQAKITVNGRVHIITLR
ncbi:MAG TPA: hypothetical protein VEB63_02565 [Chitinophagaceae bacterium]|nr:hypothetical protein [Chitinophagaceae bacterium]